jgi:ubiquinone/menaquinone biosynthesis C-methylase UbiE
MVSSYYDEIASGYDELHKEEQLEKLEFISSLNLIYKGDRLLDVGCGTGFSLDYFSGVRAVGIDPAKKLLEQYCGEQKTLLASAEELPFSNEYFDIIISLTAMQNFSDISKALKEIKRCGKDKFILSMLKNSSKRSIARKEITIIFKEYIFKEIEFNQDVFFILLK